LKMISKEAAVPKRRTIPAVCSMDRGKPWISSVRLAGVRAKIRNKHLRTGWLERYPYASLIHYELDSNGSDGV
jgi:hypothetical protein